MDFECIKYLKMFHRRTIFNHSSYRDAILQFDFFGLKDRWPTDSTTCNQLTTPEATEDCQNQGKN